MTKLHNEFVWYELMTTDVAAAQTFYSHVVGWSAHQAPFADRHYMLFTVGETPAAGLMAIPPQAAEAYARPGWIAYVGVEDVDAATTQITKNGGAVHKAPSDIPEIGRISIAADLHGANFGLFRGFTEPKNAHPEPGTPGHIGWHELMAADLEAAAAFYATIFGWTKAGEHDMGPMGIYQMFATGGDPIGGMMTKPPEVPAPFWLYYFNVPDINAAVERINSAGGKVVNGPHEVPGGSRIVQGMDPQGAMFALVAPPA